MSLRESCENQQTDPSLWPAEKSAFLICDVWDRHWSRGATERIDLLAPQINSLARNLREKGMQVVHSPTHVVNQYRDTPARRRISETPLLLPLEGVIHYDAPLEPPLPI